MLTEIWKEMPRSLSGRTVASVVSAAVVAVMVTGAGCSGPVGGPPQGDEQGAMANDLEDAFLQWPLPPGAEAYRAIDGKRIHKYVVEQAAISRRYRDQGHPQFWGRIIGTSGDAESAEWLAAKFRAIGLEDARIQPFDLQPQWMPQSSEVTVTARGQTQELDSAQPFYRAPGTPPGGLDVEAVYVGLGSEADFAGRDVRGKAVFAFSMVGVRSEDALRRAEAKGAAVVFDVHMLPGNMRYQAYPSRTDLPAFSLGSEDGYAVRELITEAGEGAPPRVQISFDVEMTPDLETALVWARCRAPPTRRSTSWPIATAGSTRRATMRRVSPP